MRPTQKSFVVFLAAISVAGLARAAQWVPVVTNSAERIEIDKSRISRGVAGRSTAWSRLAFERDMVDENGMRYTAVEAFNRYDCDNHSFTTLKRIYRRDARVVREEEVARPAEMAVQSGSVDDRLLTEVCRLRTPRDAEKVAAAVGQANEAATPARPAPMYADMRKLEAGGKPAAMAVADPPKPVEAKPRFIELPKIDKSQMEDPAKAAAKPAEAKPADTKAVEAKPAAKPVIVEKPVERPTNVSRRDYEMQLATSGPRKKKTPPKAVEEHRSIHWSYEGEGGPTNWGKLEPGFATCASGRRQSPIDIREGIIKVDLEPIKFDYRPAQFRVVDNGHTIQVEVGEGSSIKIMERQYQLIQFHFHKPSEERVSGRTFDMVAHFVHRDDDGRLAVVAVLLTKGNEHPLIQAVWNYMPLERGTSTSPEAVIDLKQLLPENRSYYTYMGSLTTPPCTEEVLWMVLKQPVQISQQQVSIFGRLYPNNARPVQPNNGRLVKETR